MQGDDQTLERSRPSIHELPRPGPFLPAGLLRQATGTYLLRTSPALVRSAAPSWIGLGLHVTIFSNRPIGSITAISRPGDVVDLIPGCWLPFVLRSGAHEDGLYQLISSGFILNLRGRYYLDEDIEYQPICADRDDGGGYAKPAGHHPYLGSKLRP